MTQTNDRPNETGTESSIVEQKLEQIMAQLSQFQAQLDRLSDLPAKVDRLEEKLLRVSNIYRYERLQNLLKAGQWLEADKETSRLILAIAGETDIERLRPDEVANLDCSELQVIDRLWLNYSNNRFGFSVQMKIYQELGGSIETTIEQNADITEHWGDRLKWRKDGQWRKCTDLEYSPKAPDGGLPAQWWNSPYGSKMTNYFLARLLSCGL
ncbi:MAG: GUN4 domain-containing protein [Pleurocapsa sp. MO_226.B13]|nr:GUN4 domain-containing protein [Pleurocapsa sp. MO_226.B13]